MLLFFLQNFFTSYLFFTFYFLLFTPHYSTLLYSALLHSTQLCSTPLYSTSLCSTLLYSALLYSTLNSDTSCFSKQWLLSRLVRLCARSFLVRSVRTLRGRCGQPTLPFLWFFGDERYVVCPVYIFATTSSSLRVTCVLRVRSTVLCLFYACCVAVDASESHSSLDTLGSTSDTFSAVDASVTLWLSRILWDEVCTGVPRHLLIA